MVQQAHFWGYTLKMKAGTLGICTPIFQQHYSQVKKEKQPKCSLRGEEGGGGEEGAGGGGAGGGGCGPKRGA